MVGRRLGIFGMGRIGRELARMARGIGMTIHYRDVTRLPAALENGAIYHDTDAGFLASCNVLSLHAPGGGATYHWLNADRIAMLPRGAVVVNAARGTLVDDGALIAALRPGYLALENVMLLPHLGSATVETRDAMGFLALDGIAAVLAGRTPGNVVTA